MREGATGVQEGAGEQGAPQSKLQLRRIIRGDPHES